MDLRLFYSPNEIIFGRGALSQLGPAAGRLAAGSALVVTDAGLAQAGVAGRVQASLAGEGFKVGLFAGVEANPSIATAEKVVGLLRAENYRLVVGLGGGSSMDVAKSAAAIAPLPGSVRDYLGSDRLPQAGLPRILIATTSGTGSEATKAAILTDERTGVKQTIVSPRLLANVALVDPELCVSMPRTITVDSGLDAFVHSLEAFLAPRHHPLTDSLALEAIRIITSHLPVAAAQPDDLAAREGMAIAANLGGLAISAGLGAIHGLTYHSSRYGLSHGRAVAVMLPHIIEYNLAFASDRYALAGEAMGCRLTEDSCRGAEEMLARTRQLLDGLGVSCRWRDYGITADQIDSIASLAFDSGKGILRNNPRVITLEDTREIYRRAW